MSVVTKSDIGPTAGPELENLIMTTTVSFFFYPMIHVCNEENSDTILTSVLNVTKGFPGQQSSFTLSMASSENFKSTPSNCNISN